MRPKQTDTWVFSGRVQNMFAHGKLWRNYMFASDFNNWLLSYIQPPGLENFNTSELVGETKQVAVSGKSSFKHSKSFQLFSGIPSKNSVILLSALRKLSSSQHDAVIYIMLLSNYGD